MRTLWRYITAHVRENFRTSTYLCVAIFLALSLMVNFHYGILKYYIRPLDGLARTAAYFMFYSVAYFGAAIIVDATSIRRSFLGRPGFWISGAFGLLLLSLDSSAPYFSMLINNTLPAQLQYWASRTGLNLLSSITVLMPLYVAYKLRDQTSGFYGLHGGHFDARPYAAMSLIMMPLVIAASFHQSFLKQYPMYSTSSAHRFFGVPEWVTAGVYELAYGLDFITVELLFRGFLVIGMSSILGRDAVLIMASLYCYLHFGKPVGEAISSIAGGYILGVIAYETRSIRGGIMVHLGIAWLMECIAFLQHHFHDRL